MGYRKELKAAMEAASAFLKTKGIAEHYLQFLDEGLPPARIPTVPTDSRSEFLANRAMGDWAEQLLGSALRDQLKAIVVSYGDSDTIAAGDAGFKDFYLSRLDAVRLLGKRPDLLLFDRRVLDDDVSKRGTAELQADVQSARCAIEVRSSKFEADLYIARRQQEVAEGKRGGRMCPSFTVKVEDLIGVYRWIRHHGVRQFYCQVFFDSVYAIGVLDIFRALRAGNTVTLEKNAKNQAKATIHIPITQGTKIGRIHPIPYFEARQRVTRLGRHDAYVQPVGGTLTLDAAAIKAIGLF